ncbi:cupredoxin domain-containing protein [Natronococcus occultus]|uniref:Copper binding protein, plastocyanin/azurin family n=1 Tax=Natronococcus occultus SP4 TaxID=694430 RepID=L0K3M6_9EURY|nr:hypothetical protein [Natronococcus occultus]AGB38708.1 hypothetical protein Natoc_2953 [Natronococcus occultus SP4]
MQHQGRCSRRRALGLAGGATTTVLAAGCLGGAETDDGDHPADEDSDETDGGENATGAEDDGTDGSMAGPDDDPGSDGDDGTEDTDATEDVDTRPEAWADVEEIVVSATTAGWEGVEPEPIAGEENPPIVLTAGREYVLSWKNEDGRPHNIELWNEDGKVVDDYGTELMEERDATQSLEFEASEEMAEYVCEIHAGWQKRGRIEIV